MPLPLLALLPTAIGLAGNVGGMIGAGRARKKSEDFINDARGKVQSDIDANQKAYDAESGKDFFDTNVASSAIRKMDEAAAESNESIANELARGGGTSNASISARAQIEDSKQDAMTDLAGQGTAYKQSLKRDFQNQENTLKNRLGSYDSEKIGIYDARAKAWENFGQNAGDMIGQGLGDLGKK